MEDIGDQILSDMAEQFRPVDTRDRQGLIDLITRQMKELRDYVDASGWSIASVLRFVSPLAELPLPLPPIQEQTAR